MVFNVYIILHSQIVVIPGLFCCASSSGKPDPPQQRCEEGGHFWLHYNTSWSTEKNNNNNSTQLNIYLTGVLDILKNNSLKQWQALRRGSTGQCAGETHDSPQDVATFK